MLCHEQAAEHLGKAALLKPHDAYMHRNVAAAHAKGGNHSLAIEAFTRVLHTHQPYITIYYNDIL
jgi:Flp pilus assembly protein TadD